MNPILAWAFLFAGPDPMGPPTPAVAADQMLTHRFRGNVPGVAVLVVHHGQAVLRQGYGQADVAKMEPIGPDTNFDLASVSKQFTAAAVLVLVERGKLSLDDAVVTHVPELGPLIGEKKLTVNHLLHQVSGLPEYLDGLKIFTPEFARMTNADVATHLAGKKLRFPPGNKFDYCNSNYVMLALIVERLAGRSFAEFSRMEIFDPLGMKGTMIADSLPFRIPKRATGYKKPLFTRFQPTSADAQIVGDGNVYSSIADMQKWDQAIAEGRLLKPESWTKAFSTYTLNDGKTSDYGCGWVILPDGKGHWHNGGWAGTRTMFARRPSRQFSVVVLSNDETAAPESIASELTRMFLPKD